MRCPKCGFISFDHLERCKKCGKDIAEAAADLEGTVFSTSAPSFLRFDTSEGPVEEGSVATEAVAPEGGLELDEEFEEIEVEGEVTLDDEVELVLGDGDEDELLAEGDIGATLAELADTEAVGPPELPEAGEVDEPVLELGEEEPAGEEEPDGLQLDFGDIDISDLAPPAEEQEQEEVEELTLDSGDEAAPALATRSAPAAGGASGGLEDLEIDDLDLDSPSPVAGSAAGGRLPPAVKTGTALDDFDIDLGELLAEGKKEKSVDKVP